MSIGEDLKTLIMGATKPAKRFFISTPLPTLNEYTRVTRGCMQASASMKRKTEAAIIWEAKAQLRGWKATAPVFFIFEWVEKDKRRDHDNVAFAKKFIQDALVKAGVLSGDGWKHVTGFVDLFSIDKDRPGVEVIIVEVCDEQQGRAAVRTAKELQSDS